MSKPFETCKCIVLTLMSRFFACKHSVCLPGQDKTLLALIEDKLCAFFIPIILPDNVQIIIAVIVLSSQILSSVPKLMIRLKIVAAIVLNGGYTTICSDGVTRPGPVQ